MRNVESMFDRSQSETIGCRVWHRVTTRDPQVSGRVLSTALWGCVCDGGNVVTIVISVVLVIVAIVILVIVAIVILVIVP
jgi:hypothetical protein